MENLNGKNCFHFSSFHSTASSTVFFLLLFFTHLIPPLNHDNILFGILAPSSSSAIPQIWTNGIKKGTFSVICSWAGFWVTNASVGTKNSERKMFYDGKFIIANEILSFFCALNFDTAQKKSELIFSISAPLRQNEVARKTSLAWTMKKYLWQFPKRPDVRCCCSSAAWKHIFTFFIIFPLSFAFNPCRATHRWKADSSTCPRSPRQ